MIPEEWKLEIKIMDRALVPIADQLIGSTVIDLEDRLYCNPLYMIKRSLTLRQEKAKDRKKKAKKEAGGNKKRAKEIKAEMDTVLRDLKDKVVQTKRLEQFYVPVEFRELWHPSKEQPQGILECWAEVLTTDDAGKVGLAKM